LLLRSDMKIGKIKVISPMAGKYKLLWRVPYMHSAKTESSTAIEISSSGNIKRITVNQSIGTGTWQESGVFDFAPGAALKIIASKSYGVVIADGFALVPQP